MQKDKVAKIAMMVTRLGVVLALVLGLNMWFDLGLFNTVGTLHGHMGAGALVLIGILIAAVRFTTLGRGGVARVWIALALGVVGALTALGIVPGGSHLHIVLMLTTVGLAEASVAKLNRA